MKNLLVILCLALAVFVTNDNIAAARMAEPASVPQELKGTSPHNPKVSMYYFHELVQQGVMTEAEATASQKYMVFRHNRRQKDLRAVQGMTQEDRRSYMKEQKNKRENVVQEYARFCGLTLVRAEQLMNLLHDSDKGTKYYKQLK